MKRKLEELNLLDDFLFGTLISHPIYGERFARVLISQKLKELLHYMENTTRNNAVNGSLQELHSMVEQIKHNKEVSISYMKLYERERMMRREALTDPIKAILSDLGPIPESILVQIDSESDPATLNRWLILAARANSLEEFAEKIS